MNTSLISIIIPVYNVEAYLYECVDSVLRQTYRNLEIILVDDGSTDSSPVICDEFAQKDNRVQVLHKPNGGPSDARNAGVEVATGDYVYFLDSDDYIENTLIEECLAIAEKEQADFIFFDAKHFYEDNTGAVRFRSRYVRKQEYAPDKGYVVCSRLLSNGELTGSVPFLFINMQYIRKYHFRFYKGILCGEDLLYTSQLYIYADKVAHINKPLYYYRRRPTADSITTAKKDARYFAGYAIVCHELLKLYQQEVFSPQAKAVIRNITLVIHKTSMFLYCRLSHSERQKAAEHKIELCNDMKAVRFLGSLAARLRSNFTTYHLIVKFLTQKNKIIKKRNRSFL